MNCPVFTRNFIYEQIIDSCRYDIAEDSFIDDDKILYSEDYEELQLIGFVKLLFGDAFYTERTQMLYLLEEYDLDNQKDRICQKIKNIVRKLGYSDDRIVIDFSW